jgi:catechol 2,3-dioxygenase-like lactoylglutathione lyase family enzyme
MDHLALAVHDQERSRGFYARYLGFDAAPPHRYPDGTLMLHDSKGFSLALCHTDEETRTPSFNHFGIRLSTAEEMRAFRDRLAADAVPVVGWWDEPGYVSVKFKDPDGYIVEVFWEPE